MGIEVDTPEVKRYQLDAIPLFPLPNAILFPHTTIQLHIFESRYRHMTRDAIRNRMPSPSG